MSTNTQHVPYKLLDLALKKSGYIVVEEELGNNGREKQNNAARRKEAARLSSEQDIPLDRIVTFVLPHSRSRQFFADVTESAITILDRNGQPVYQTEANVTPNVFAWLTKSEATLVPYHLKSQDGSVHVTEKSKDIARGLEERIVGIRDLMVDTTRIQRETKILLPDHVTHHDLLDTEAVFEASLDAVSAYGGDNLNARALDLSGIANSFGSNLLLYSMAKESTHEGKLAGYVALVGKHARDAMRVSRDLMYVALAGYSPAAEMIPASVADEIRSVREELRPLQKEANGYVARAIDAFNQVSAEMKQAQARSAAGYQRTSGGILAPSPSTPIPQKPYPTERVEQRESGLLVVTTHDNRR